MFTKLTRLRVFSLCALVALPALHAASPGSSVPTFAGNAQHTANYAPPAQPLNSIHWSTSTNFSTTPGNAHYGAPLISAANTVFVPVRTAGDGFQVSVFNGSTGQAAYTLPTDYIVPTNNWFPVYQPVIATPVSGTRLYYAGPGGTIYYITNPDSTLHGAPVQLAFYGLANYTANSSGFNSTVFVDSPLTSDSNGNIFFGFRVQGTAPAPLNTTQSGFARIDPNGNAVYVLAGTAAGDAGIGRETQNSAPALSNDQSTLYVAVKSLSSETYGYLLGLDSTQLTTKYKVLLRDPRNGNGAGILDISTASPMVAPDNDVYFGIFSNPDNGSRGFLLRFSGDLKVTKIPGGFGWDYTAAVVPASMVPSYQGSSSYLIFSKYNSYAGVGDGDGVNKVVVLDPNATEIDPHPSANGLVEMREVLSMIGFTADAEEISPAFPYAVREWCINTAAVNPATKSVYFTSEDGYLYRWDLTTNSLSQAIQIGAGTGEPYVPTIIGPDGTVYTLNGGTMFAVGGLSGVSVSEVSSVPDARTVAAGQPLTFTATVANTGSSGGTPTGTVTFQDLTFSGATPVTTSLGSFPLSGGQAAATTSTLPAGPHFITAIYSGDGNFAGGRTTLAQRIHAGTSTTTLGSSLNPSTPGQSVRFTATVTGGVSGTPTGMVTFQEGAAILAQVPLSGGTAAFSTSALSAGNHSITAVYYSDTVFAASSGGIMQQVTAPPLPTAVSVTPNSGNGLGPQIFRVLYTDSNGASDLQVVYLDVGTAAGVAHTCFAAYVRGNNALYLFNDTNSATLGPLTPGVTGTLSNSQCTLSGAGGPVTYAGNNLTVPFALTFAGVGGSRNIYGLAQNYAGASSGWQTLGSWTVPSTVTLGAASVAPNNGSGLAQVFNALYTDPAGSTDLQAVYLDFGATAGAAHGCIAAYVQSNNSLYLFDDNNSSALGPIAVGGSSTITNSQCKLSANGGAVTGSGTNLTAPFSLTFLPGFTGSKNIYGLAQKYNGTQSAWQLLGTWTPAPVSLAALSVSPINSSGFGPQVFSAVYSDPNGAADLQVLYLDFGSAVFASGSCIVGYVPASNALYLFDDNNAALPAITAGTSTTVSNSQCTLSGSGGTATATGNNLTVPFAITFANGFVGAKNVYGLAQSYSGSQSPWQNFGTWTP